MIDWLRTYLDWLTERAQIDTFSFFRFENPKPEEEIAEVESQLKIELPTALRDFYQFSDGIGRKYLFNLQQLKDFNSNEVVFYPANESEIIKKAISNIYYSEKPNHWLTVSILPLSAELYCLDTSRKTMPVMHFDPEMYQKSSDFSFPDINAYLLEHIYLMTCEDLFDEVEEAIFEEAVEKVVNFITSCGGKIDPKDGIWDTDDWSDWN